MSSNSSNDGQKRDLDDVLEENPESKRGDEGEAVHGGDQAGPNSARGGQPIAEQTGDPRANVGIPGEGFFGLTLGTMPFRDRDSPLWYDIHSMFR